ncbi:MAG: SDR family oxidoreductase [Rhodothermales bacterium]
MSDRTVLVAGASGNLGSAIINELKARGGFRVRALTRKPERVAHLPADETVIGDLRTPSSLEVACKGADAVIGASGASLQLRLRIGSPTYRAVDYEGNLNLLTAAQTAGVERFVYVSVYAAEGYDDTDYVRAHTDFADHLVDSGLAYTVVEPTGYFSAFDLFVTLARGGVLPIIGDGTARTNPIAVEDLAEVCVDGLDGDSRTIPIGGPATFTRREIAELAFEALGKKPRIVHLPPGVLTLNRTLVRPLDKRLSHLLHFFQRVNQTDAVATPYGSRHLHAYFRQLAQP